MFSTFHYIGSMADYFTINNLMKYDFTYELDIYTLDHSYYRCEAEFSENENNNIFSLSNPIWFRP